MSSDIVTLQHKLMQAQRSQNNRNCGTGGSNNQPISFYRMHTAAIERANYLLESGQFSDKEIAYHANLPLSVIESETQTIPHTESFASAAGPILNIAVPEPPSRSGIATALLPVEC